MLRYTIKLSKAEVAELTAIVSKGAHSTYTFRAAFILLNCDEGPYGQKVGNEPLAQLLRVNARTIERGKGAFVNKAGSRRYWSGKPPAAAMSAKEMARWKPTSFSCVAVRRPKDVFGGHSGYWPIKWWN